MGQTFAILSQLVGDNTSFKRFVNDFHAKQEMRFLLCVNVSDVQQQCVLRLHCYCSGEVRVLSVLCNASACMNCGQPTLQRIRPEHAQTLERYSWESTESTSSPLFHLHGDLFLLIQSVVVSLCVRC